MLKLHKLVSTSLGIGYIGKGGGTVAAVAACLCLYALHQAGGDRLVGWLPLVTALLTLLGVWSANEVEPYWGKDDKKVVIDEVAGMCISLLFLPITGSSLLAGLVLFRFFDIAKPLYIRKLEKVSGGWGVMLDDVVAGVYANFILQLFLYFKIL
ncbi:phosphatidylglycerophosphatase A [Pontibacter sp. SGAir0037]|uniref:phosphatidylglycerophosphatase A family protein n=1 Tax=Pontibacter sp. SGAir0037 TaxID=2571030 RepID=UPI0010CCF31D|nr:phosphatidylglycerophosphatase A [Pontibacter sp. SGAir0037]QCR21593.1 phosphatidylglycerophosphatase A [Pontibacter sp. SGAir0037]